jgi:two-component system cell cycle sensor histidine kinase/response regulator CckA
MIERTQLSGGCGAPSEQPRAADWKDCGKVLIVDDEDAVRTLVAHSVQRLGFVARLADAGPEAVSAFQSDPASFSLAILDVKLPGIDGFEVLSRIRAVRPDLPAILMSGYYRNEPAPGVISTAPTGFLPKPFTLGALASAIRSILKS